MKVMGNIDPRMVEALKLDEDYWEVGNPRSKITTRSGSTYYIESGGELSGKMKGGTVDFTGLLHGAVYRGGGPIRPNKVVYGLSMEFHTYKGVYVSSAVEKIESV